MISGKGALRTIAAFIIVILCFFALGISSFAVSTEEKGSITLILPETEDGEAVSGAVFRIYRFAAAVEGGEGIAFSYVSGFSSNGMSLSDMNDSYLPVHLRAFAEYNALDSEEGLSDAGGKAVFGNLATGAYLVVPVASSQVNFKASPFIVTIPMADSSGKGFIYDITASPKAESGKEDSEEKTYISVKKEWLSDGEIPDSITVSLLKDGIVDARVSLNEENNWYYRWDELSSGYSWSVVEAEVPDGFTVSYSPSQMSVVITNKAENYEEHTKPDDTTPPSDIPEETTKPDELIDTGQLNWPVPVFAIAGLLLFSTGWSLLKFGKKDGEAV